MAHFTCEHGTRYHPFGRGGRENLLAGCRALLGEEVTQPVGGASKLGGCGNGQPHSHPVGESCGGVATHVSSNSVAFTAAQGISESYLRLQHCPLHSLPLTLPESTTGEDALLPVSVAAPQSDAAATYRAIAHDVIVEVFKTQMGALLVRIFNFLDSESFLSFRPPVTGAYYNCVQRR